MTGGEKVQDFEKIYAEYFGEVYKFVLGLCQIKRLLKENNLPDIRWHDLRATFATILIKKDFNLKAISRKMGHSKQIITADVYGDKKAIIEDCLEKLNPFLEEILPKQEENIVKDYTKESEQVLISVESLIKELTDDINQLKDYSEDTHDITDILNMFWATI